MKSLFVDGSQGQNPSEFLPAFTATGSLQMSTRRCTKPRTSTPGEFQAEIGSMAISAIYKAYVRPI